MSNNVNVFSLNAGSSKEAVKVNSKANTRTLNTEQENFSQTLDQAPISERNSPAWCSQFWC